MCGWSFCLRTNLLKPLSNGCEHQTHTTAFRMPYPVHPYTGWPEFIGHSSSRVRA